ncbi:MAG: chitobiase/beta-hexosaminidase C-terminal domain-containing protein [Fibrobacterota bacterium]
MKQNIFLTAILLLLFTVMQSVALTVTERTSPAGWNQNTKVAVIWNDGTGGDEMPAGWNPARGELGEDTKDFVNRSLHHLDPTNIREYHGQMNGWDTVDLTSLKNDFGGELPHAIVYVNAGFEWAQELSWPKPKGPYDLLEEASDSGVGIVAVGDDAAFDAKQIFDLTGPGGTGDPIQYDSQWPGMGGAANLYSPSVESVWMTTARNDRLLWEVSDDTLFFKDFVKGGRGQLDADIWDIDTASLDDFSFSGFQQLKYSSTVFYQGDPGDWKDDANTPFVGATPTDSPAPVSDTYQKGYTYIYTILAGLQFLNNRVAMIGYQPQYLADTNASAQIIYNAVYWASKAKNVLKIGTPKADPASGDVQDVADVGLQVDYPKNSDLYTLRYTLDGSNPTRSSTEYSGRIPLPKDQGQVTLKAIAFSEDEANWLDSDMLTVTYGYSLNKIATPKANPAGGNTQSVTEIKLSVDRPADTTLYDLRYTLDGSDPASAGIAYTGPIDFPDKASTDVVLKAIALSQKPNEWQDSDMLTVTYPYEGGPVADSAHFFPGKLADLKTSRRDDDTLTVFFNAQVRPIAADRPFRCKDGDGNKYSIEVDTCLSGYDTTVVTFVSSGFRNKPDEYLPEDTVDSISVDPTASVTSKNGITQDGTNNSFGLLRVFPVPPALTISSVWIHNESPETISEIIDNYGTSSKNAFEKGVMILIDPRVPMSETAAKEMDCALDIFDNVGNKIARLSSVKTDTKHLGGALLFLKNRYQLALYWDGTNSAGRKVGAGSYLGRLRFRNHEGNHRSRRIMLTVPSLQSTLRK